MPHLEYVHPARLSGPAFFGDASYRSLDRLRTLLILTGHGHISDGAGELRLSRDFMAVPNSGPMSFSLANLLTKIPGGTPSELRRFLSTAGTKNIRFHRNICAETTHCVYHFERKNFIASFVHLYRLVEHAALYLPMVSVVAGANDLTFKDYQQVIDNKAKADLSVLRKFSVNLLDSTFRDVTVRISFSSNVSPANDVDVVTSVVQPKHIVGSGPDWVELKYGCVDRLIVGLRNEFFHYLYHEKNISLARMRDPEGFLRACLPAFLTYFAFLYRQFFLSEWELWS